MDSQVTGANDQMSATQGERSQILGFPNTNYSDQNSKHIDAEKATAEKSNEECCQEQQTLQSRSWHHHNLRTGSVTANGASTEFCPQLQGDVFLQTR